MMHRFLTGVRHPWNRLHRPGGLWILLPFLCVVLFLVLYVLAARSYPGGSAVLPAHPGFDVRYNYLCDLLDEFALNGELNAGRFYARAALFSLCAGLLYLWFYLPGIFAKTTPLHYTMWLTGLLSLGTVFFMAADNHDLIVRLAGVFGVIGIVSCSIALFQEGLQRSSFLGILCTLVFLVNYYIYETSRYIEALPLIQKVTFVLCLVWFLNLNYHLYQKSTYEQ